MSPKKNKKTKNEQLFYFRNFVPQLFSLANTVKHLHLIWTKHRSECRGFFGLPVLEQHLRTPAAMTSPCTFFYGKLVLVTGGGGGIGRCVSQALASEGARVMVADISLEAAEATVQCLPGTPRTKSM